MHRTSTIFLSMWWYLRAVISQPALRRRAWVVIASLLVCSYAVGVFLYVVTTPEIGVRCAFTRKVSDFHSEFLYPVTQEPLKPGEYIVQIANQPVTDWAWFVRKLLLLSKEEPTRVPGLTCEDLLAGKIPASVGYVELDGEALVRVVVTPDHDPEGPRRSVWCRLGPPPVGALVPSVLWFVLKIGVFIVGALVFWRRPEDRTTAPFFWLVFFSFGAFLGGYHWFRIITQPGLLIGFLICAVLLPAVTLHFYLVFPHPKPFLEQTRRWVWFLVYGPPLFFLLLFLKGYLSIRWLSQEPEAHRAGVQYLLTEILYEAYVYFGIAALYYAASVVCLLHSYRTAESPMVRNQVRWLLIGALSASLPILYSLYLAFQQPARFAGGGAIWPMFAASALITAAYTISITRYRLMQLDQLINSGMAYILISLVAGLLYYGLLFAGIALIGSQTGELLPDAGGLGPVLAVSTTALVLTATLDLLRGSLLRALNRHFRREKNQLDRTLQRMSQAIDRLVDPPTLARRLLHTAADLLGATRGAVYLRQESSGDLPLGEGKQFSGKGLDERNATACAKLYQLTDSLGPAPALTELSAGCPLVEACSNPALLLSLQPQVSLPNQQALQSGPATRQLHFLGGEIAQGLLHEGQLLGFLLLGPKDGGPYTAEEAQLLTAFAQITALALVSAEEHRLIERLNSELKAKVEKIAEQQRRILVLQSQLRNQQGEQSDKAESPRELSAREEAENPSLEGLVGSGPRMQQLMQLVRRVAVSSSVVLLRGDSGTGKELLARALHHCSPRANKPFVKVHCAALSPGLLESELFGHVKGAFTSAVRDKMGRFESADGGTLFLDEIGDISLEVQTKLLRVLEEMVFERVGSSEPVRVDVRVLAATHQDLEGLIRQGRFREDLFFRLNVLPITVPPLRERLEDIPELVLYFLRIYSTREGKALLGVDDDALMLLKSYHWPGNVRQLENAIERAIVIAEGPLIQVGDLPAELQSSNGQQIQGVQSVSSELGALGVLGKGSRDRREREHLVRALAAAGGNKAEAARALGLARSTLLSRLKRYGLS